MPSNPIEHDVLAEVANRWSPYRFDSRSVEPDKLLKCFEAARWAASSFNEQPWRWMIALRDDAEQFDRMLGCLLEANQIWAAKRPSTVDNDSSSAGIYALSVL